jgi:aminopeptidase N
VRVLRTAQFPEDAGPMAHPVRPDSYVEINNFYTVTIYEKGAEVVRMQHNPGRGRDGFAKGMKLYFERHDGQAVTCDDFAQAIADANPAQPAGQLAAPVQALVQPGRHAPRARQRRYDASRAPTRSRCRKAAPPRRASRQGALRDPGGLGLVAQMGKPCPCSWRAAEPPGGNVTVLVLTERQRTFTLSTCRRTRAVAAARLQRAGGAGHRLHRRPTADPAGARHRPLQPLGSRPAPGAAPRYPP